MTFSESHFQWPCIGVIFRNIIAKKENISSKDQFILNASKVFDLNESEKKDLSSQFDNKKLKEEMLPNKLRVRPEYVFKRVVLLLRF